MRQTQQVLTLMTLEPTMRADVQGWGGEDPKLFQLPIWKTPGPGFMHYQTVLEALAAGWKLLSSPTRIPASPEGYNVDTWDWWLVRDGQA